MFPIGNGGGFGPPGTPITNNQPAPENYGFTFNIPNVQRYHYTQQITQPNMQFPYVTHNQSVVPPTYVVNPHSALPPQAMQFNTNQQTIRDTSKDKGQDSAIYEPTTANEDYEIDSEDIDKEENNQGTSTNSKHDWQTVKKRKRNLSQININSSLHAQINTSNRYEILSQARGDNENTNQTHGSQQSKTPKPPPIYIHGVTNYDKMVESITKVLEKEQYNTTATTSDTIKINPLTTDSYRKLAKHLKDENIIHHTYQLKEERAYKVFIRNLHYSVPTDVIKKELAEQGHIVRNIINVRHRVTKQPLPLFMVDLEPNESNKKIFDTKHISNIIVQIEPPRKKNVIPQCTRCQDYGHTKTYCNKPFSCVKCGGGHNTSICKKTPNSPAKCALCGGSHPANYKGCTVYQDIQRARNASFRGISNRTRFLQAPPNINEFPPLRNQNNNANNETQGPPQNPGNYLQACARRNNNLPVHEQQININEVLSNFLTEFKTMFSQLISQNSMILNMLSTVINKIA